MHELNLKSQFQVRAHDVLRIMFLKITWTKTLKLSYKRPYISIKQDTGIKIKCLVASKSVHLDCNFNKRNIKIDPKNTKIKNFVFLGDFCHFLGAILI